MRAKLFALARRRALKTGRGASLWRALGAPTMEDWAEYLRRHGGFAAFGEHNAILPSSVFADPGLTRLGSNVRVSGNVFFTCHDGSVNMINRAYGLKLDNVGPITVGDDVSVGQNAIVLPNVEIGDRVIVGAGAVVSRSVPSDSIVAGAPAKVVGRLSDYVERLKVRNAAFPWSDLIQKRAGGFDAAMEPELLRMRQKHFFGAADPQGERRPA